MAIESLTHTFTSNKIHGIMGHNGAGKTTLLRMIGAIIQPTSGSIKIGKDLDVRLHADEIKSMTGFLPESGMLYKRLTAREFLEFVGHLRGLPQVLIEERIDYYVNLFEFNTLDRQLQELSRGMQQKVLLISALIHDPKIILLDEPIATLDPVSAVITRENIKKISRQERNIIIASHIPSFIEQTCDDILLLENGRMIARGTMKEILDDNGVDTVEEAYLMLMKHGESRGR